MLSRVERPREKSPACTTGRSPGQANPTCSQEEIDRCPAAHRQLRMLALEQSRSVQDLMTEATNDLFQKLGKARIAD